MHTYNDLANSVTVSWGPSINKDVRRLAGKPDTTRLWTPHIVVTGVNVPTLIPVLLLLKFQVPAVVVMSVIPSKMRAAVWGWTGGASFDQSSKVPTCGRDEVLIRVKAAAINPVDYKLGRMLGSVVGLDVAGVVESVGSNVTSLNVGDEVFGGVKGSLAEFAVGKPESLGKKAKCLSFVEAAAMPIAYMTSLQSLRDAGKLEPGSRVLIIGASGG